ncbi:Gldg family protein [Pseudomonas sp. MRSN 12121]|uniref:Gldg family protein n=1 Tax=Pseudomonas sp. MRSN 12121 TaxID=1611770 RepID=UPI0005C96FCC|nr:Gldg family protein [Pseudomonas sp. MRSN 12121]
MRKTSIVLCLSGLALLLPGLNLGLAPCLQDARWDLTEDQLYSVSQGTLAIIRALPEPVELTLYFSREQAKAAVSLRSYAQRVQALLREYERRSRGRLNLKVVDPAPFSREEEQARSHGLQSLSVAMDAPMYFGLVASSDKDHWKSLPLFSIDEQNFLEYDISRLLQSLGQPEKPGLGLISTLPVEGDEDPSAPHLRPRWQVMVEIHKAFEVKELSGETQVIPDDLRVLMLVHPKRLSRETLRAIDQFVLRGGRLLVFVDPYSEQDPGESYFGIPSKDKASTLTALLGAWGLRLRSAVVVADDEYGQYVNLPGQPRPVWQPTALTLPGAAMNPQDVVTAGLTGINLSTAGVLEPTHGASTRFTPLLSSSAGAGTLPTSRLDHLTDPAQLASQFETAAQRLALAARIEGPAHSAYVQREHARPGELSESAGIHVIAVADTDVLSDSTWIELQHRSGAPLAMPWADNGNFVLNALDNLSGSDELIGLRSRGHFSRTFGLVEQMQGQARARLHRMNAELQGRLDETDRQLARLQRENQSNDQLSAEQQATMMRFTEERQAIEAQMRRTARASNLEIERLGEWLKAVNIALVPLLIGLLGAGRWASAALSRRAISRR